MLLLQILQSLIKNEIQAGIETHNLKQVHPKGKEAGQKLARF